MSVSLFSLKALDQAIGQLANLIVVTLMNSWWEQQPYLLPSKMHIIKIPSQTQISSKCFTNDSPGFIIFVHVVVISVLSYLLREKNYPFFNVLMKVSWISNYAASSSLLSIEL